MRETAEGKPVRSARCSATPPTSADRRHASPSRAAPPTGKRVAVVGGGPAGLACAHRLAMLGHDVVVFEARAQARRPQRIRHRRLQDAGRLRPARSRLHPVDRRHRGRDRQGARPRHHARELRRDYDAVFLGIGLAGVNALACAEARRSTASTMPSPIIAGCARPSDLAQAAGRPPRRGDRRRQHRDRHRGADASASAPRT